MLKVLKVEPSTGSQPFRPRGPSAWGPELQPPAGRSAHSRPQPLRPEHGGQASARPVALWPAGRVVRPGNTVFPELAAKPSFLKQTRGNTKGGLRALGKPQEGRSLLSGNRFWTRAGDLTLCTNPAPTCPPRPAPALIPVSFRRCHTEGVFPADASCLLHLPDNKLTARLLCSELHQELWKLNSSPPSGQFLERALKKPSGRHTVPEVEPCPPAPGPPGRASRPGSGRMSQPIAGGCMCVPAVWASSRSSSGSGCLSEALGSTCPPAPCLREGLTGSHTGENGPIRQEVSRVPRSGRQNVTLPARARNWSAWGGQVGPAGAAGPGLQGRSAWALAGHCGPLPMSGEGKLGVPTHPGSHGEVCSRARQGGPAPTWRTPAVQRVSRPGRLVPTFYHLSAPAPSEAAGTAGPCGPWASHLQWSRQALVYCRLIGRRTHVSLARATCRAQTERPTPMTWSLLSLGVWGGSRGSTGRPEAPSVRSCPSLPLHPRSGRSGSGDQAAVPFQLLQMKPATTSSMATSRWTAPRTSTSPAPWSSTGGPWTCTRRGSSTSWRRGPPTRA